MVVCTYCRKERPFWAVDENGTGDYSAHIISGTNAFVDTAGKRMRFRFCPMCGRPLTNPPDDGGGMVSRFLLQLLMILAMLNILLIPRGMYLIL